MDILATPMTQVSKDTATSAILEAGTPYKNVLEFWNQLNSMYSRLKPPKGSGTSSGSDAAAPVQRSTRALLD